MQRLVLVHGSVGNGDAAWLAQRELADRYDLVVLNRPGFPPNPLEQRIDFEDHGRWVAERLNPGDHLCGHSYGAVVSLFAASQRDDLRTLTVIEPPAFGLAQHEPDVVSFIGQLEAHWQTAPRDPRAFLAGFYALVAGRAVDLPDPLPPDLEQGARALMVERGPWEARPPLSALAEYPYPKMVVSGGWSPVFDAVCDVLENQLNSARLVCPGSGHNAQAAPGFNEGLVGFLAATSFP